MKIKLSEIFAAKPALDKLFNQEMPPKVAFKVADLIDIISPEFDKIEKVRVKLVNQYIEEGENTVTKNFEGFSNEFKDFLDDEVEIVYEPSISFNELPDNIELTPVELRKIRFLFSAS